IALSTLFFIFADSFFDLMILRIFQGIGVALTVPASMSLMTAITHKESRGGSRGVYSTFRMIGFASGPVIGGFLQVHFGFDAAFYVGSALILLSMFLVQIWVKEVTFDIDSSSKSRMSIFDPSIYSPGIFSAAVAIFVMACCFSMVTTL